MSFAILVSMSLFALAASLSPGPVNLVCLSTGVRFKFSVGFIFVTGSTLGFIALFVLIGLVLQESLAVLPWLTPFLKLASVVFLLYLSYQMYVDNGEISPEKANQAPSFWTGAIMQWLNPKAWLASLSGIISYTSTPTGYDTYLLFVFAFLYLPICLLSLSTWVVAGRALGHWLETPAKIRLLNKSLAFGLAASCLYILLCS